MLNTAGSYRHLIQIVAISNILKSKVSALLLFFTCNEGGLGFDWRFQLVMQSIICVKKPGFLQEK